MIVKKAPQWTVATICGVPAWVEIVLEKTGIAKVAKWLLGEDCGCEERKEKLNKLFPYAKPKCLTEEEFTQQKKKLL